MSRLRSCVLALTLALAVLLAAAGVAPHAATASPGAPGPGAFAGKKKAQKKQVEKVQRVVVRWQGTARKRVQTRAAVVPGIGTLTIVCRPNATLVRLRANDRQAETQMWMAKYETKNDASVVAVKTARVYRYATAADDGRGGTGFATHEGLNQRSPIENYSSGHLDGVISQRPGRHQPAAGAPLKPVTSFRLTWWWTGFEHPMSWRSCKIDVTLRTRLDQRMGVTWHGEADAAGNALQRTTVPGLGTLLLRCEPDADGFGGIQSVALAPAVEDGARMYVEQVTGEGHVEDHVETVSLGDDPETGQVGPVPLPRNGMLRVFFTVAGRTEGFIVSSYHLTNNARSPALNVCEVAAAAI